MVNLDPTVPMGASPPISSERSQRAHETLVQRGAIAPPSTPGVLGSIGRFDVIALLGEGGMGLVYLAREQGSQAQVAIKIMKTEVSRDPREVRRFLAEARHMRGLSHPHILRVLDVLDRSEGPCYVMPYARGGSLRAHCRPGTPLPERRALSIAQQVAQALAYAHARGIIHRDIKPDNVLLDAGDQALLTDFGLVRTVFNDSMVDVTASHLEGTAPYMSPAVASGEAEDTRCDIYAFGALLYELLTGQPPYSGPTPQQVLDQVLKGPPPPIRSINPKASAALVTIAETCMARELRDRYASMDDVVADLNRVACGAKPLGRRQRRRYTRAAVVAGAAAVVVLAAGAIYRGVAAKRPSAAGLTDTAPAPAPPVAALDPKASTPSAYVKSVLRTFAREKRRQMQEMAAEEKIRIHPQFDRLFDGIEEGNPETVAAAWNWVSRRVGQYQRGPGDPELDPTLWNVAWAYVLETYGAWEQVTAWKPELLRIYGEDVSGSIPADAVFFGGTDAGRFVTTPFCDVVRSNRFIVITQNALADNSYMAYVRRCHGARLSLPAESEISAAFQTYAEEVVSGKRPRNPDVTVKDGKVSVSGALGVMAINGLIAQMIFDRNKARHAFFVEEGYAIPWMSPFLTPYGLVMKLNAEPPPITDEMAAADHRFWEEYEAKLCAVPAFASDLSAREAFGKLRSSIGGLYAARRRMSDAEKAFRQACRLAPGGREAAYRLAQEVLVAQGRFDEAIRVLEEHRAKLPQWVELSRQNPAMRYVLADEQKKVDDLIGSIRQQRQQRGQSGQPSLTAVAGDFTYTTNAAGQATVTGLTPVARRQVRVLVIPETLGGSPVTEIGARAFSACTRLTRVTIPGSVTNIGDQAFRNCSGLTELQMGPHVVRIGKSAFEWCNSLRNFAMPASVCEIGEQAFVCSAMTGLEFPDSLAPLRIRRGAFEGFSLLSRVSLPKRGLVLTAAFINCYGLRSIVVDPANRDYASTLDGVLFSRDGSEIVCCPGGKTGSYTIPDGVTRIGEGAFQGCINLSDVTIPASVTHVGKEAFVFCPRLTDVFFRGNAPSLANRGKARGVFDQTTNALVRYRPGTTGWGPEFGGRSTAVWGSPVTATAPAKAAGPRTAATADVMTPQQVEDLNIQMKGTLSGIGAILQKTNALLVITRVFPGSPAEKAGLKVGQAIAAINAVATASMALADAVNLIRGPKGTQVELAVVGPSATATQRVSVVRDIVSPSLATGRVLDGNVGLLTLPCFSEATPSAVADILKSFATNGVRGIVADLRGNGGGSLRSAADVAGLFVGKGPVLWLIRPATAEQVRPVHGTGSARWRGPLVVLVDGFTAVAAELFASAMQKSERAKVVGQKTYGKAVIESLWTQPYGSAMRIVEAHVLTATGEPIDGVGIRPDVVLDASLPREEALRKAVEALSAQL
jgi:C-terminal peptidase prc